MKILKILLGMLVIISFASCSDKSGQWSKEMKNLIAGKCSVDYQDLKNLPDNTNLMTIYQNDKKGYEKILFCQKQIISKYTPQEFMSKLRSNRNQLTLEMQSYLK